MFQYIRYTVKYSCVFYIKTNFNLNVLLVKTIVNVIPFTINPETKV